ncbi:MAG: hypothetical protein RL072_1623 [Actinomycetota bacterium]|jgi:hypothetical protein
MASHFASEETNSISRVAVPGGALAYRQELRRKAGAFVAGGAVGIALFGVLLIALPGRITGLIGFALIIAAFPLLVAFGIPLSVGIVSIGLGVVTSLALWFVLAQWAAHRTTKDAVADWSDWWRTMWPLALAMAIGGGGGFVLFVLGVL